MAAPRAMNSIISPVSKKLLFVANLHKEGERKEDMQYAMAHCPVSQ